MEFKIKTFQNEEGIFAEVLDENDVSICVGDGDSPYNAIADVCLVFSDILNDFKQSEDNKILNIIKERKQNDDGVRYTLEDVKKMMINKKDQ